MKTLMKLGWGSDAPAFRQLFTSSMIPDATKEQADALNELQRLSASPECASRYIETASDFDVRQLLPKVKGTNPRHARPRRSQSAGGFWPRNSGWYTWRAFRKLTGKMCGKSMDFTDYWQRHIADRSHARIFPKCYGV